MSTRSASMASISSASVTRGGLAMGSSAWIPMEHSARTLTLTLRWVSSAALPTPAPVPSPNFAPALDPPPACVSFPAPTDIAAPAASPQVTLSLTSKLYESNHAAGEFSQGVCVAPAPLLLQMSLPILPLLLLPRRAWRPCWPVCRRPSPPAPGETARPPTTTMRRNLPRLPRP